MMCPWSSWRQVAGDFPIRGLTVGPHEHATMPAELRHLLCTQLNLEAKLGQLKHSKIDPSMWP
jgi:hypothetical protein